MNKKILGAVLGLSALLVSAAASAHVDVAVRIGVPGYYAPAPGTLRRLRRRLWWGMDMAVDTAAIAMKDGANTNGAVKRGARIIGVTTVVVTAIEC